MTKCSLVALLVDKQTRRNEFYERAIRIHQDKRLLNLVKSSEIYFCKGEAPWHRGSRPLYLVYGGTGFTAQIPGDDDGVDVEYRFEAVRRKLVIRQGLWVPDGTQAELLDIFPRAKIEDIEKKLPVMSEI